jgi:hypothetical protein
MNISVLAITAIAAFLTTFFCRKSVIKNINRRVARREFGVLGPDEDYMKYVYRLLPRFYIKLAWFFVLSAIILIFHSSFIAGLPLYFFAFFFVGDLLNKIPHRKNILVCQFILCLLLIVVYAFRPF